MKKFSLLGAPGSGKGTFGKLITQQIKSWQVLSVGDFFRNEIKSGSQMGQEISSYLNLGQLVPDSIVNKFVMEKIAKISRQNNCELLLLDGFPRTLEQCKHLQENDLINKQIPTKAILIDVPEWIIINKLLGRRICAKCNGNFNICDIRQGSYDMPPILPDPMKCIFGPDLCRPELVNRSDDTKEIIQHRLTVYNTEITSIVDFYKSKNLFCSFTVHKGVSETDEIIKLIKSIYHQN